jgi:hypothetical protein
VSAIRLMASSKNLKVVKEACGHGSIATTTRYAHVYLQTDADGRDGWLEPWESRLEASETVSRRDQLYHLDAI